MRSSLLKTHSLVQAVAELQALSRASLRQDQPHLLNDARHILDLSPSCQRGLVTASPLLRSVEAQQRLASCRGSRRAWLVATTTSSRNIVAASIGAAWHCVVDAMDSCGFDIRHCFSLPGGADSLCTPSLCFVCQSSTLPKRAQAPQLALVSCLPFPRLWLFGRSTFEDLHR